jgi:hypothetical protein
MSIEIFLITFVRNIFRFDKYVNKYTPDVTEMPAG